MERQIKEIDDGEKSLVERNARLDTETEMVQEKKPVKKRK